MPRLVKIAPGFNGVALPNGGSYNAGAEVTLSDDEFSKIAATALGDEVLDLGAVDADDFVSVQAAHVAAAVALTSAPITGGESPTEAEYNALQADVAALRTKLNAVLTALTGAGKPMAV